MDMQCMKENKEPRKRKFRRFDGYKYGWLKDMEKFLVLIVVVFLVFQFVISVSVVKGDSMEHTLKNGEGVLYGRLNKEYKTGDVVSVKIPSGEYYVKRIIATEGDTIDLKDGQVYLNEKPLDESYAVGETVPQQGTVHYPMTLEKGQVFVMGDNREDSMDSRTFGVIGTRQIKGKLLLRFGRWYVEEVE